MPRHLCPHPLGQAAHELNVAVLVFRSHAELYLEQGAPTLAHIYCGLIEVCPWQVQ